MRETPLSPLLHGSSGARLRTDLLSYQPHPNPTEAGSGSLISQLCNVTKSKGEQISYLPSNRADGSLLNSARIMSWKSGSELSGVEKPSGKLTIHTNLAFTLYLNRGIACLKKGRLNRIQNLRIQCPKCPRYN